MTYKVEKMASTNHTESFNLLLTGSESGSDIPDFTIPKRKVRVKRKNRPNNSNQRKRLFAMKQGTASFCNSSCTTSLCVSFIMIIVAILMVLIWFIIQLRFQIDQLSSKFISVEASNKGMPVELHDIHTKMKILEKNYTQIKLNLTKLNDEVFKINSQIADLKKTSGEIKKSIEAAPVLKDVPESVDKLLKNVASIGSKITNVEDKIEKLKSQHSEFDAKHKSFTSSIKQVQDAVSNIEIPAKPKPGTDSALVSQLEENIQTLEKEFELLNSTLLTEMNSLKTEQSGTQVKQNANFTQDIRNYVNQVVTKSLLVNVPSLNLKNISIEDVMTDVNNMSKLYLQLLVKLNQTSDVLINHGKNSSLIVDELIHNFVRIYTHSKIFTDVQSGMIQLNATVAQLEHNEQNMTARLDHALLLIKQLQNQETKVTVSSTKASLGTSTSSSEATSASSSHKTMQSVTEPTESSTASG